MTKRRDFTQKQVLRAVHESDLEQFLDKLGLLQEIDKGTLKCYVCGQKITKTNFHCVYPFEGEIRVCCDNPLCYEHVLSSIRS